MVIWLAPALLENIRLGCKGVSVTNALAYFDPFVREDEKKFDEMGTCGQCYKTFFHHH